MTVTAGDMPDWTTQVAPLVTSNSATNQSPGAVVQIFQSATPYRIWGVWVSISAGASSSFTGAPVTWGAQIGDGSGIALVRAQVHLAAAGASDSDALSLALPGFTPKISGGFFTTNLVCDAAITNVFARGNGGILFSQP